MYKSRFKKKYNLDRNTELDFDIMKICSRVNIDDLEELYGNYKYEWMEKMKAIEDGYLELKCPQDVDSYVENKICYFLLKLDDARDGKKTRFVKNAQIAKRYLHSSD